MSTASHFNIKTTQQTQLLPSRHAASRPSLRGSLLGLLPLSQMVALVTIAFVFLFGITYFFHPFAIDNSYATDSDTTVNVASNISISATDVSISDIPDADGSWLTGTSSVVVSTNNETGYKLYMSSSSDQVDLLNSDNNKYKIENLSAETTEATFKSSSNLMNHYGFTHDNNGDNADLGQITPGTYLPVTNVDNAKLIKTTEEKQNISQTNVTFATKVDRSIPAGEYSNTITFTAIANPTSEHPMAIVFSLEDAEYLQEVDAAACNNSATQTYASGKTYSLKDKRTEEAYLVRKLADGRCWMVENLYLTGGTTITPAYSDITDSTVSHYADTDETTTGFYTIPVSVSGTVGGQATFYTNTSNPDRTRDMNNGNKATGSYYSWPVATAGTGTAYRDYGAGINNNTTDSICPKNWKIPYDNGDGSSVDQFATLYNAYDSYSAFATSFNYSPVGGYFEGTLYNISSSLYLWSRKGFNGPQAYHMSISNTSAGFKNGSWKYNGYSVRCVLSSE